MLAHLAAGEVYNHACLDGTLRELDFSGAIDGWNARAVAERRSGASSYRSEGDTPFPADYRSPATSIPMHCLDRNISPSYDRARLGVGSDSAMNRLDDVRTADPFPHYDAEVARMRERGYAGVGAAPGRRLRALEPA